MRSLSSYRGWATLSNAITALQAALAVIFDLLWRPLQLLGVGYQLETERVYELWSEREYTFEKERDSLKEMKSVINSF